MYLMTPHISYMFVYLFYLLLGLCSLTVKVGHRMSSAIFSAIAAECKASKKKKKATKKKKGGKKKK